MLQSANHVSDWCRTQWRLDEPSDERRVFVQTRVQQLRLFFILRDLYDVTETALTWSSQTQKPHLPSVYLSANQNKML